MFLDTQRLAAMDGEAFRATHPYPWANPADLLTESGYRTLIEHLPDVSVFKPVFGRSRKHGQQSHTATRWNGTTTCRCPRPGRNSSTNCADRTTRTSWPG